jgi:hypothetical protein
MCAPLEMNQLEHECLKEKRMNTKRSLMMTVGPAATIRLGLTFAAAGGVKNVTTNMSYALEESI